MQKIILYLITLVFFAKSRFDIPENSQNKMDQLSIQQMLFKTVKSRYPSNKSLVTELAGLLDISVDSAYRRIRGEKTMSLNELRKLCVRFSISMDNILQINSQHYLFSDNAIGSDNPDFGNQLDHYFIDLEQFKNSSSAEMLFFTGDISIFYFYQFPELLAFKYFYWMKSVFGHPDYQKLRFSIAEEMSRNNSKGVKASRIFTEIDGTEIWSLENISLILQQFQFMKEMQLFADPNELNLLYDKLNCMIDHIEMQAETGRKFMYGQKPGENSGKFKLYINEFMSGGNNILVRTDDNWIAYINHSIMNYLRTYDPAFCSYVHMRIMEVIKKSDLISSTGEKQRKQFFNRLRDKIHHSRNVN